MKTTSSKSVSVDLRISQLQAGVIMWSHANLVALYLRRYYYANRTLNPRLPPPALAPRSHNTEDLGQVHDIDALRHVSDSIIVLRYDSISTKQTACCNEFTKCCREDQVTLKQLR